MKQILFFTLFLFGGICFAEEKKASAWSNVQNFDWNEAVNYIAEQLKITKDQAIEALQGFNDAILRGETPKKYWDDWATKNKKTLPKDWMEDFKKEIKCLMEQNKAQKNKYTQTT